MDTYEIIFKVMEVVVTGMASLNLWFIARLIKRIDNLDSTISSTLPQQGEQIKHLEKEIKRLAEDFRDVSDLKSAVAVLKYAVEELQKKTIKKV